MALEPESRLSLLQLYRVSSSRYGATAGAVTPWMHQTNLEVNTHLNWRVHKLSGEEREREREIHYVHSASLAYEDGIVFKSEPSAARQ